MLTGYSLLLQHKRLKIKDEFQTFYQNSQQIKECQSYFNKTVTGIIIINRRTEAKNELTSTY